MQHKAFLDGIKDKNILSVACCPHAVVCILVRIICEGEVVACRIGVRRLEMGRCGGCVGGKIWFVIVLIMSASFESPNAEKGTSDAGVDLFRCFP
jgi:hypothetical protein